MWHPFGVRMNLAVDIKPGDLRRAKMYLPAILSGSPRNSKGLGHRLQFTIHRPEGHTAEQGRSKKMYIDPAKTAPRKPLFLD